MATPEFCTDPKHLGRWGQDPMCGHCRRVTGQPRTSEPGTRLRWRSEGVLAIALAGVVVGFILGLNLATVPAYPFH